MRICLICPKILGKNPRQKFCSQKCKTRFCRSRFPDRYKIYGRENNIRRHGISPEEYELLLVRQNYRCAICKTDDPGKNQYGQMKFAIDHNHQTGIVRGLLCGNCNHILGKAHDDLEILRAAIEYLQNAN